MILKPVLSTPMMQRGHIWPYGRLYDGPVMRPCNALMPECERKKHSASEIHDTKFDHVELEVVSRSSGKLQP
jgi:hypothetical protein